MGRGGRTWGIIFVLAATLLLAAGCASSGFVIGPTLPVIDLTGGYASAEPAGELGILLLALERVEDTRVFKAGLLSAETPELEPSPGVGTLGDYHLILNFDRGLMSDYYFEGMVELAGEAVSAIRGQFIFPDQAEPLPVVFEPL